MSVIPMGISQTLMAFPKLLSINYGLIRESILYNIIYIRVLYTHATMFCYHPQKVNWSQVEKKTSEYNESKFACRICGPMQN